MISLHGIVDLIADGWRWQSIGFTLIAPDHTPHKVKAIPGTRLYELQPC